MPKQKLTRRHLLKLTGAAAVSVALPAVADDRDEPRVRILSYTTGFFPVEDFKVSENALVLPAWDGSFPPPGCRLTLDGAEWRLTRAGHLVARKGGTSPCGVYEVVDAQAAMELFGTVEIEVEDPPLHG